jgi:hypothetical protein
MVCMIPNCARPPRLGPVMEKVVCQPEEIFNTELGSSLLCLDKHYVILLCFHRNLVNENKHINH